MNKSSRAIFLSFLFVFSIHALQGQNPNEEAYKYITEAKTLSGKNRFPHLEAAQAICASGCADSIMGSLYRQLGVAHFQARVDREKSLAYTDQAIEYLTKAYGENHPKVFTCQYNRGTIAGIIGHLDEAATDLLEAINKVQQSTLIGEADRDSLQVKYLRRLSVVYLTMGDYDLMGRYANQSLTIANARWKEPSYLKGRIIADLGYVQFQQHNYEATLPYYLEAVKVHEASSPVAEETIIIVSQSIGLCYYFLDKLPEAEYYFDLVLNYYKSLSEEEFQKKPSFYKENLAFIYANFFILRTKQERWKEAETAYQQALTYAQEIFPDEKAPIFAHLYKDRAVFAANQGLDEEALRYCQKAKAVVLDEETSFDSGTIFVGKLYDLLEIIALEASLFEKTGNVAEALAGYKNYDQIIGLSRQRVRAPLSKSFLIDSAKPIYEKAIALCLKEYDRTNTSEHLQQAFKFNAANKSILLFEEFQSKRAIQYSGIPITMIDKEEELRYDLISFQQDLADQSDEMADSLKQVFNQQQQEYDFFMRQMEQEYPKYYQLKHNVNQVLDPTAIQQNLEQGQALVEYFIGEKDLFAFVLYEDKMKVMRNPIIEGWQDSLLLLREFLSNSIEEDCEQQFIRLSHQFYQWLLAPAVSALSDETIDRLVIVPDGLLTLLPFEALLIEPLEQIKGSSSFVLEDFAISYSYSSRTLTQTVNPDRKPAGHFFAGFGLEYDEQTLAKINAMGLGSKSLELVPQTDFCGNEIASSRNLGHLQYSDDEVQAIAELFGGEQWLNEAATKAMFLAHAPNYEILHMAMHGSIDPVEPLNSALIFTYQDSSEFLLRAADIYSMELNGQMAVLSACNTAAGNWSSSTGPMSLARAFHYANIPSVVASLWSISDHSTAGLMRLFYQYLAAGLPKDIALQKAKIEYLNNDTFSSPSRRTPVFWAGPVIIGDALPIQRESNDLMWWLAVLILLSGLFLWRRKKERQTP